MFKGTDTVLDSDEAIDCTVRFLSSVEKLSCLQTLDLNLQMFDEDQRIVDSLTSLIANNNSMEKISLHESKRRICKIHFFF